MNRAAIYARYSSENQRPESIDDQISSCRKFAIAQGFTVLDNHIYSSTRIEQCLASVRTVHALKHSCRPARISSLIWFLSMTSLDWHAITV